MVKKKIDNRIRVLIENGVASKQRSMFVVIGDKGRDQVVILHHMLSKAQIKARPNVLWCYKKELGFSSHRKKKMRKLEKKIKYGKLDVKEDDPFELFVASTNIRYCYYNETHKILGNTFGMLILQDFEALTPNLLARTVETIEGGGIVVILLRTMTSLRQFYAMSMDVHSRFRTESHQDVVARFNERFLLSLANNKQCLVVDDQLNILPISSKTLVIEPVVQTDKDELTKEQQELASIKETIADTQPASAIVNCCKTLDQAKCVLKFIDAIAEKQLRSTISLTAARGRGKSAALGLSIASAVAFGYSNIFVTSPTPENLKTLFDFVLKGFDALDYQEHVDYEVIQSTNPEFNNAVIRVNIFKDHRQTIQYINPKDSAQLGQAELVVIDEAAAIPLPLVKNLLGPYLVFMASTINGYEGTGRSLSLKLLQQLRQQTASLSAAGSNVEIKKQIQLSASGKVLHEVSLNESIRYANGDLIEKWLNDLLCLNCCQQVITPELKLKRSCPIPESCDLYYINRDTLFSYHKISELFLQHLMSLYVASHYKNTPNDLQMLSDAPAHHLFCLLGPFNMNSASVDKVYQLPEILCVVQVCLEGEISKDTVVDNLKRGKRANGDLIPWTVSQQFQDNDFPNLLGARVVRIATNPDYQAMGYGSRALKLLQEYYEGKIVDISEENNEKSKNGVEEEENGDTLNEVIGAENVDLLTETIEPKKNLPPLLLKLNERRAERLDYLGVSFGLTNDLLRFWKKSGYVPVYLRQTTNDLTGEHSCIMIKELNRDEEKKSSDSWLYQFFTDFRRRFLALLGYEFRFFLPSMAINMLKQSIYEERVENLTRNEMEVYFTQYDYKRLEQYALNLVDYHLIMDLVPNMAKLFYLNKLGQDFSVSAVQSAILLGLGLQYKSIESLEKDLQLPSNQLLALFNKVVKKFISLIEEINVTELSKGFKNDNLQVQTDRVRGMVALKQSLDDELNEEAEKVLKNEKEEKKANILQLNDLKKYEIKANDSDWSDALKINTGKSSSYVSVKRMTGDKRKIEIDSHFDKKEKEHDPTEDDFGKKSKKHKNNNNNNNNRKKDKFFTKRK